MILDEADMYLPATSKPCSLFVRALSEALRRSMQHRAKDALGLRSVQDAEVGALTFIQRTDSALRLSPHLHVAQLDGVYVRDPGGRLQFHSLPDPTEDDVAGVAIMTATTLRRGLDLGEVDTEDALAEREPLVARCYAASALGQHAFGQGAGKPVLRRIDQATRSVAPGGQHVAESQGVQVFCDHPIEADDRQAVLALCRYLYRPFGSSVAPNAHLLEETLRFHPHHQQLTGRFGSPRGEALDAAPGLVLLPRPLRVSEQLIEARHRDLDTLQPRIRITRHATGES